MSEFGKKWRKARNAGRKFFYHNGRMINTMAAGETTEEWLKNIGESQLAREIPKHWRPWDVIKNENKFVNSSSQEATVKRGIANNKGKSLVVDKTTGKMSLYENGKFVRDYSVLVGKNKSDSQTVTRRINGKIDWDAGNFSTGAGEYTVSRANPSNRVYYGLPSFNVKNQNNIEVPTSLHAAPRRRLSRYGSSNPEVKRATYGCINVQDNDLVDLLEQGLHEGDKLYILPEEKGNRFVYENGQLNFRASRENREKALEYIDQRGQKRGGHGINYTINTLKYRPMRANINKYDFLQDVNKNIDYEDESFGKIVKPFLKSLEENKQCVMKNAKVTGDTYNDLSRTAFGILGAESNYGDEHGFLGNLLRGVRKFFNPQSSSPDYLAKEAYRSVYDVFSDKPVENTSTGLTQVNWKNLDDEDKTLLSQAGIAGPKDFMDPKKAALGTTLLLANRYKYQLNDKEKQDIMTYLPTTWNRRESYSDVVNRKSKYLDISEFGPGPQKPLLESVLTRFP